MTNEQLAQLQRDTSNLEDLLSIEFATTASGAMYEIHDDDDVRKSSTAALLEMWKRAREITSTINEVIQAEKPITRKAAAAAE